MVLSRWGLILESQSGYSRGMTKDEVIRRLGQENRAEIARATGLRYMYLSRLAWGKIKNPGSDQVDTLRSYFLSCDIVRGRPS